MMKIIGVIPSRYSSSRFPGKPLADICGRPMVWWVYQQALRSECLDAVYVATDDEKITETCRNYGMNYIMTSVEHKNGTERLTEVCRKIDADYYITIQGDEPITDPRNIKELVSHVRAGEIEFCATMKTPYKDPVDVINQTTPKVVNDVYGNVLLFTRSPVPYPKAAIGYTIYKPMGLYAFSKKALEEYSRLEMGPLEKIEEIELLRFVEHGLKVKIYPTTSRTVAVDTKKDLERVIDYVKSDNGLLKYLT